MAAVTNAFTVDVDTNNVTSYASPSFTPAAGDLLIVFAVASGSVAASPTLTASANGLTFSLLSTKAVYQTSLDTEYAFVADQLVPGSPSAMTVTFDCTGDAATGCILSGARISGMTLTGTAAIKQAAKVDNVAGGVAPSTTFGAACQTGNPTLFAYGTSVGTGSTQPTGWTERADGTYGTPTRGGGYSSRDSGFTGTGITLGSSSNGLCCALALELDASAGSTAVEPDDASHAHAATQPTLTQHQVLTPDAATHAQTAGSPTLVQHQVLAPANATHVHTATSPTLSTGTTVTPANATHAHAATSPSLTQHQVLAPANAAHGQTATSPSLTQHQVINPAASTHAHAATSPALTQHQALDPDDSTHAHAASSPTIVQHHLLEPDDAAHGHVATSPIVAPSIPPRDISLQATATYVDWIAAAAATDWSAGTSSGNPMSGQGVATDWAATATEPNPMTAASVEPNPMTCAAVAQSDWTAAPITTGE